MRIPCDCESVNTTVTRSVNKVCGWQGGCDMADDGLRMCCDNKGLTRVASISDVQEMSLEVGRRC